MKQKEVSRLILRFQACASLCLIVPFSKTFRGGGEKKRSEAFVKAGKHCWHLMGRGQRCCSVFLMCRTDPTAVTWFQMSIVSRFRNHSKKNQK